LFSERKKEMNVAPLEPVQSHCQSKNMETVYSQNMWAKKNLAASTNTVKETPTKHIFIYILKECLIFFGCLLCLAISLYLVILFFQFIIDQRNQSFYLPPQQCLLVKRVRNKTQCLVTRNVTL